MIRNVQRCAFVSLEGLAFASGTQTDGLLKQQCNERSWRRIVLIVQTPLPLPLSHRSVRDNYSMYSFAAGHTWLSTFVVSGLSKDSTRRPRLPREGSCLKNVGPNHMPCHARVGLSLTQSPRTRPRRFHTTSSDPLLGPRGVRRSEKKRESHVAWIDRNL